MIEYKSGTEDISWDQLYKLYSEVGLVNGLAESQQFDAIRQAFESSYRAIFAYDDGNLVGAGRLISDGICYGSIFDVGILPSHQKQGIGKAIMLRLVEGVGDMRVYLTSTFGNEDFYKKLGYRKHKTAFALFSGESDYVE